MAKIYGLHLFCTLVILALLGWQIGWLEALHREWGKLLLNVLLLQAWIPDPAWSISLNGASWYLSAALFLYFCFPRLSPLVSRLDKGPGLSGGLGISAGFSRNYGRGFCRQQGFF